jgi:hypothetical protein
MDSSRAAVYPWGRQRDDENDGGQESYTDSVKKVLDVRRMIFGTDRFHRVPILRPALIGRQPLPLFQGHSRLELREKSALDVPRGPPHRAGVSTRLIGNSCNLRIESPFSSTKRSLKTGCIEKPG